MIGSERLQHLLLRVIDSQRFPDYPSAHPDLANDVLLSATVLLLLLTHLYIVHHLRVLTAIPGVHPLCHLRLQRVALPRHGRATGYSKSSLVVRRYLLLWPVKTKVIRVLP